MVRESLLGAGTTALAALLIVPLGAQPAAAAATAAATPAGPSDADRRIAAVLPARFTAADLGPRSAGLVVDAGSARTIWARRPDLALLPASNAKVPTAVTALRTFGPAHRFLTGVSRPSRYVVTLLGGGDPSLSTRRLDILAEESAKDLGRTGVRRVSVVVADGIFGVPRPAPGWAGYSPRTVTPLRGLVVDQHEVADTGLDAGRTFARLLVTHGIGVVALVRAPRVRGARQIAGVAGSRVDTMVRAMLLRSDNDIAETLFRQVSLHTGFGVSWVGAAAAHRRILAQLGTPLRRVQLYDGSGLSRWDLLTAPALIHLLAAALDRRRTNLRTIYYGHALPVAGRTGTLRGRYQQPPAGCAKGRIAAKTGTLRDVVALSGVARGADGRRKLFSLLVNARPGTLATKRRVDLVASSITGCW